MAAKRCSERVRTGFIAPSILLRSRMTKDTLSPMMNRKFHEVLGPPASITTQLSRTVEGQRREPAGLDTTKEAAP